MDLWSRPRNIMEQQQQRDFGLLPQYFSMSITVVSSNTADLGTDKKAAVFGNRRYLGGGGGGGAKQVALLKLQIDQFLKLQRLRNDKMKLSFSI